MLCVVALALMLQPSEAVSVYVGPNVRGGFVDVDRGVQDSIEDLRQELRGNPLFHVVGDESAATLRLYIGTRKRFDTGDSVVSAVSNPAGSGSAAGVGVAAAIEGYRVEAILRVGEYERPFVGESKSRWKGCAQSIAADLGVWLKANVSRLPAAK